MNNPPPRPPLSDEEKKKNVRFALILGAIALFMFVSFIVKTALKGP